MKQRGEDHVYLDVTHKDPEETKEALPEHIQEMPQHRYGHYKGIHTGSPAARYLCGGIKVDLDGQSSIRLYAIGECSCTGLHGGKPSGQQLTD